MDKVKEYRDYILEHCNNVKKAFQVYGELLCNELGLNLQDMQNQINEHDESKWSTEEFELYRMKFFRVNCVVSQSSVNKSEPAEAASSKSFFIC